MNYLFWIDRFVIKEEKFWNMLTEKEEIVGVDVGTGASLIYPLIGNKIFGWKFIAT
jgi:23S rRNA A1618 N6-methylase RlmF